MTAADIDWGWIGAEFQRISGELQGWRLIGEAEFEVLSLSRLTYGLVRTPTAWLERDYGRAIYVAKRGEGIALEAAVSLALELGAEIAPSLLPPLHLRRRTQVDHFSVVERAIATRTLSQGFVASWGCLHALYARYQFLVVSEEVSGVPDQKLKGLENSTRIQRHWFAYWLQANGKSFGVSDRHCAGLALATVCNDVLQGVLAPWGPYPRGWYRSLLDDARENLRDEYYKLGPDKLRILLHHPLIKPEVVPPLSRSGFSAAHPGDARAKT